MIVSLISTSAAAAELGPWSFRAQGAGAPPVVKEWMAAVVPGCVHTDLMRAL